MSAHTRGQRLRWLMRLVAWLPLPIASALGALLGDLITRVPLRFASAYRTVLINLIATQPQLSLDEARRIGRQSLRELGRSFCEFAHVWQRPVEQTLARITSIEGEQAYLDACAEERPVLLLSLHQGSWETINLYLGRQGNTTVMYQPHPATLVDALVKKARERTGCRLVPTNSQGVKEGLATLRGNGTLALLADHNPGNRSNPFVPFFGHEVPTPALVDKLVRRYRPRIFVVSCYRGEGSVRDVRIRFEAAPQLEQAADEACVLTLLNRGLEDCIRRNLPQYQWTYKRFKWRPGGRRLWYRQSLSLLRRLERGEDRAALGLAPPPLSPSPPAPPPPRTLV
ncbi:MAG: lysophospholipid acyltransferase family protein [Alcanivorax sp.]|uniref:Lysophospholipid acyltransferase family protein n=1 Tax=Alloalcanivorax marinus TaxID=1177169 RepID=A0A9Q3YL67_9GAMM|nr:lysophospholipid acyltransferase family protein [Alloalcanivorax marinus]MCC4307499.1 lysophospholipid acyltransferase family protein [Alloalcanivorax marinus]